MTLSVWTTEVNMQWIFPLVPHCRSYIQ